MPPQDALGCQDVHSVPDQLVCLGMLARCLDDRCCDLSKGPRVIRCQPHECPDSLDQQARRAVEDDHGAVGLYRVVVVRPDDPGNRAHVPGWVLVNTRLHGPRLALERANGRRVVSHHASNTGVDLERRGIPACLNLLNKCASAAP